jgi:SPFH domain / Band 7 family
VRTFPAQSLRMATTMLLTAALLVLVGYVGIWRWMVCRTEVPAGSSLLVRYKGPWPFGSSTLAPEGTLVKTASGRPIQVGILEDMPGPGRHFYSPLEYETHLVKDEVISPGKIGVLVSKLGKPLPEGTYLVDAKGYRGILRKVLTPGRYRINTYAYDVKVVDVDACAEPGTRVAHKLDDPTLIPPGYVGVVTNKANDPTTGADRGIQQEVLQPGIYFVNPEEKRIDIVSIGYSETSLTVQTRNQTGAMPTARTAAAAAPMRNLDGDRLGTSTPDDPVYITGKGIEFPSSDGFPIHLDYTAIWGILPAQAPNVVRQFGTLKDVEHKVILPQIESICRLHGSRRGAVDLLVGDTREQFQIETSAELERVLTSKNLSLLFGLTRHIYVPKAVREPIQKAKIADELTKTRDQEQLTAKAQAELTESKAKVVFGERRTRAETEKKVAEVGATGEKKAKEIAAMTEKLKAEIDAKSATIDAQTTRALGEAKAQAVKLAKEAKAERSQLLVKAMGGPGSYERYIFAEGLPADLKVGIFYAGTGTLWTDLKGFEQTMLGKIVSETQTGDTSGIKRTAEQVGASKND